MGILVLRFGKYLELEEMVNFLLLTYKALRDNINNENGFDLLLETRC